MKKSGHKVETDSKIEKKIVGQAEGACSLLELEKPVTKPKRVALEMEGAWSLSTVVERLRIGDDGESSETDSESEKTLSGEEEVACSLSALESSGNSVTVKKSSGKKKKRRKNVKVLSKTKNESKIQELYQDVDENTVQSFLCVICMIIDDYSHLRNHIYTRGHKNNIVVMQTKSVFKYCKVCNLLIVGNHDMQRQHVYSVYHELRKATEDEDYHKDEFVKINLKAQKLSLIPNEYYRTYVKQFGKLKMASVDHNDLEFIIQRKDVTVEAIQEDLKALCTTFEVEISPAHPEDWSSNLLKSNMIYYLGHHRKISNYISKLVKFADETLSSPKYQDIRELLERLLKKSYPNCSLHFLGAMETGLITNAPNLDIFVETNGSFPNESDKDRDPLKCVQTVESILKKSPRFKLVSSERDRKIPVVTAVHGPSETTVDMYFSSGMGVINSQYIRVMVNLRKNLKGIILFLLVWFKSLGLKRKGFSTYAFIMLIIYYLQREPTTLLPTMVELVKLCNPVRLILDGYECWRFPQHPIKFSKIQNKKSEAEIILDFLSFFKDFELKKCTINTRSGETSIKDGKTTKERFILLDPFRQDYNLCNLVHSKTLEQFQYYCSISFTLMSRSMESEEFKHLYYKLPHVKRSKSRGTLKHLTT